MDLVSKQREQRKQRILETAHRLIGDRGYEGVTMRELADESLVSVPTLYNLFGGKNELLSAAVEAYFTNLIGGAERESGEKGLARILALCRTLSVQIPRNAEYSRSLMAFFGGTSESSQLRELVARELTNEIVQSLEEMKSARQLAAYVDTVALGERLASLLIMTCFEWATGHVSDASLGSAVLFSASALLNGFARGKAAALVEETIRGNQASAVVPRNPELIQAHGDAGSD